VETADRLENKKVLVTGASRGIGRAIALEVAKLGADVAVHYSSSKQKAEELARAIEKTGRKAVCLGGNWVDPRNVEEVGEKAWEALGHIDILVNNVGINIKKHVLDFSVEEFDKLFQVNLRGAYLISRLIGKKMVQTGIEGQLFTVTSVNAVKPGTGLSLYGGTKAALDLIMKGFALELAPHNIRVNTLQVGPVETDMNEPVLNNPDLLNSVLNGIPLHRMATPEEIAGLVCALISQRGSYMTGSSVLVDGGLLLLKGYSPPKPYGSD
jgi:NAD(P)-dependent dehydrogenase (short-subunit alcohol dehydrogenase family)